MNENGAKEGHYDLGISSVETLRNPSIHPSSIYLLPPAPVVAGVGWSPSQLSQGESRVTLWTSHSLISGPHTHAPPDNLDYNSPHMHVFRLWEEAGAPRENPQSARSTVALLRGNCADLCTARKSHDSHKWPGDGSQNRIFIIRSKKELNFVFANIWHIMSLFYLSLVLLCPVMAFGSHWWSTCEGRAQAQPDVGEAFSPLAEKEDNRQDTLQTYGSCYDFQRVMIEIIGKLFCVSGAFIMHLL